MLIISHPIESFSGYVCSPPSEPSYNHCYNRFPLLQLRTAFSLRMHWAGNLSCPSTVSVPGRLVMASADVASSHMSDMPIIDAPFHASILFQGLPGEKIVRTGLYVMLNARQGDQVVGRKSWEKFVHCGAKLNMSVIVKGKSEWSDSRPRCSRHPYRLCLGPALIWYVIPSSKVYSPNEYFFPSD